jgi:predicted amidohydrolase YtcJ
VFEKVNQDLPFEGLNWFFDHAETISDQSIERIAELGGGIAIQHRMAYQGEYFVERYGLGAAEETPPIRRMMAAGVKISAGTDATRVSSYNPWVALAWLVTGKTLAGLRIYPPRNCLDRETALRLWTENVTWFSNEEGKKGRIQAGQFADLMLPDRDYFSCAERDSCRDGRRAAARSRSLSRPRHGRCRMASMWARFQASLDQTRST